MPVRPPVIKIAGVFMFLVLILARPIGRVWLPKQDGSAVGFAILLVCDRI
jgi:hypothetical protein